MNAPLALSGPLVDRFGRIHRSLRVSVTDRCNIRCQYCMSDGPVQFLPKSRLLTFEQIARFVAAAVDLGLRRVRLTGGEPLVRAELYKLVQQLKAIPHLEQLAMTTNGMMLSDQAEKLAAAGLDRVNISLDTLREQTFRELSRREGVGRVIAGIDAAIGCGLAPRLNALVLRDVNFAEAAELVEFAIGRGLTIRFIEFMPLDADRGWEASRVVTGEELRAELERRFGALQEVVPERASQPSRDYRVAGSTGVVGFIDPVSRPFCGDCDRLRLTAEGKVRNCLFGREEWDAKTVLDRGLPAAEEALEVARLLHSAVAAKHASHGIAAAGFAPPERAMYQIGG